MKVENLVIGKKYLLDYSNINSKLANEVIYLCDVYCSQYVRVIYYKFEYVMSNNRIVNLVPLNVEDSIFELPKEKTGIEKVGMMKLQLKVPVSKVKRMLLSEMNIDFKVFENYITFRNIKFNDVNFLIDLICQK